MEEFILMVNTALRFIVTSSLLVLLCFLFVRSSMKVVSHVKAIIVSEK